MENTLTADGNTGIIFASRASLLFTGSLGGGTLTLKRLKNGADASVDANWVAVQDNDGVAVYNASPGGNYFQFGAGLRLRATLADSTAPNLECILSGEA